MEIRYREQITLSFPKSPKRSISCEGTIDISSQLRTILNPYAAGGLFCQYRMMQKHMRND